MKSCKSVFIYAANYREMKGIIDLIFWGKTAENEFIEVWVNHFSPMFFIPSELNLEKLNFFKQVRRKSLGLCSFEKQPVDCLYFDSQSQLVKAKRILEKEGLSSFEADIGPCQRFLMERFINGWALVEGEFFHKDNRIVFRNPIIKKQVGYEAERVPFVVASLDIETGVASGLLYSIACEIRDGEKTINEVFLLDEGETSSSGDYLTFSTEKELLLVFFKWFQNQNADIIIGWHVIGFDLAFLYEKCKEHKINFQLSRNELPVRMDQNKEGKWFVEIPGIVVLDGPSALRGAFYQFSDYRLESVSQELLNKGKLINNDQDKIAEIERLFAEDKKSLAAYNLLDCQLVHEIFEKTEMISLFISRVVISGMLMEQVGRSTAAFDHYFLPRLHREGFVAKNVKDVVGENHAAGGFVMDPQAGIYRKLIVLDFKSLYPSIIRTFKIDPLSLHLNHISPIMTPSKHLFSKERHILPECIEYLFKQRVEAKKNKNTHLSQAIKILMNSFYGVMGSFGCRFYHPHLPNAITKTGQWLLKQSKLYIEKKGYQVVYGDTDSLFVKIDETNKSPNELGHQLAENLNTYWKARLAKEYQVESFLEMEFEKCYDQFVLCYARGSDSIGAKKRYVGKRLPEEGGGIEFVGMESVRSDWTEIAKKFQRQLYERFFNQEEIENWIFNFVKEIRDGKCDEFLVYHKRLRKKIDEYVKNLPPQVKAAKLLNNPNIKDVRYVMTSDGPIPIELKPHKLDYEHYIEKQIEPIANSLLIFLKNDFRKVVYPQQLKLFDDS